MTARRKTLAALGCGLALLSIAACGGVPRPVSDDARPPAVAGSDGPAAAVPSAGPGKPESARADAAPLDRLPGMTAEQVVALLGAPPFLRGETAVELWRYRGDSCVLHLFLYRSGGGLRVRHAEVRPRPAPDAPAVSVTADGPAANDCLAKLAAARTEPTS